MYLTRKSMSEDNVDYLSNTLAFGIMMILSFVTLFITLTPTFLMVRDISEMGFDPKDPGDMTDAHPHYTAQCWVPPEFTQAMTAYTNKACSGAVNSLAQGRESKVKVYKTSAMDDVLDVNDFKARTAEEREKREREIKATKEKMFQMRVTIYKATRRLRLHITNLASYGTPFLLFTVGLCLKVPTLAQSIFARIFGSMNVDQTLQAAQKSLTSNPNVWQKLRGDIIGMTLDRATNRGTSLLYLFTKILMVATAFISATVLEEKGLIKVNTILNDGGTVVSASSELLKTAKYLERELISEIPEPYHDVIHFPHACQFETRSPEVKSHTVDCLFSMEGGYFGKGSSMFEGEAVKVSSTMAEEALVVYMYKSLFSCVILLYVVLGALNSFSLIDWFLRLFVPWCRTMFGIDPHASMDHVFLVSMAWNNVSGVVARDLMQKAPNSYSATFRDNDGVHLIVKEDNQNL